MAVAAYPQTDTAKARGAFYTPPELAEFLTRWAIRGPDDRTLEPACGDGIFVQVAAERYRELGRTTLSEHLFGIELEPQEAEKARRHAPDARFFVKDFFEVNPADLPKVDAVIGNPPYIRYHGFTGDQRARGLARAKDQGLTLSNLASSWAHFVAHSAAFLGPSGRLALVLPAELLHTDYAAPIRKWLLERFRGVTLVNFDRAAFADAQVDALLLLADSVGSPGLHVVRVRDIESVGRLTLPIATATIDQSGRWSGTGDPAAIAVYDSYVVNGQRLGDMASVDIGVVTGANRFFVLETEKARTLRIPDRYLLPIVESASDLHGLRASPALSKRLLFVEDKPTSKAVQNYLAAGIRAGIPSGYKCRTRKTWYHVPLPRQRPDLLLPYMNNLFPRLYVNRSRMWSTNLIHGLSLRPGAPDPRALATMSLSAAVMLSAEVEGRSYGGGVLKLETKEAESLVFPRIAAEAERRLVQDFRLLDGLVRRGQLDEASEHVDDVLDLDHRVFLDAAQRFRHRRLSRRRTGAN